jgi:hypothetical protein
MKRGAGRFYAGRHSAIEMPSKKGRLGKKGSTGRLSTILHGKSALLAGSKKAARGT